ncbi:putative ABC transport system permease protein [Aureimonas jatrophae]|uniref:Putative ABC transport system permease protein n=2 Tax=Aureimonas jatrophae TaxID=1166073 RepID=A0A1H0BX36_9HYPH|nr:putative ABC transport system permease protein [Aureimonas jatrophae]SDN50182.1 putative ABC transport system permease protein [Aureimonas jatrophae]
MTTAPMSGAGDLRLAWRFALREMRGGLRGFVIFLLCLTLGVASIAAVNSVSTMMTEGITREGRTILGGDMRFGLNGREASAEEQAFLARYGEVSPIGSLRSMARLPDGLNQTLAEVKAVGPLYPLFGAAETDGGAPLADLLAERNGRFGAVAAPEFFDRLGIQPGATVRVGSIEVELRARLVREPDVLSDGFIFAPRLMVSLPALAASQLVQPGSLVEYDYKLRFSDPATDPAAVEAEANRQFPQAGWSIRDASRAAPSLQRNIERFSQFLTLVGLTALIVGGVGIANAVGAYLDAKRTVIATFKSLGAGGRFVVAIYLFQILVLSTIGVALGLVLGAIAPFGAARFLEAQIPVAAEAGIYPGALALAAAFGYLTALCFAILPLGRTRDVAATALFRSSEEPSLRRIRWSYALTALVLAALIAGLAFLMASDKTVAGVFLVATAVAFAILRVVAEAIRRIARRLPRVRSTPLRLAIGNIHRPGALTASVVLSLGLGLTLLVALATIDNGLRREIGTGLAARAPAFFFVDIQNNEIDPFRQEISQLAPGSTLEAVPMLRGRITQLNGVPVGQVNVPPEGAWVLRGDRGVTYAATAPENTSLTDGEWWPADYAGEPLVSFAAQEGQELGLEVGQTITVNVLGREITARIANFRVVEWESLSINFVMVFSPNAFAGAPHAWLATLDIPNTTAETERTVLREISNSFPAVTTVRVKDALDAVNALVAQLALAIRAAAAVALVASVLVLSGALAAGNRARVHDAVVLKTLGATRATLIRAYVTEYMALGTATAAFAIAAGALAAWYVVARIMRLPFAFDAPLALSTLVVALVLTVGFGLAGTWRVLGQRAAPVLREL